jgi:hypothetical protein
MPKVSAPGHRARWLWRGPWRRFAPYIPGVVSLGTEVLRSCISQAKATPLPPPWAMMVDQHQGAGLGRQQGIQAGLRELAHGIASSVREKWGTSSRNSVVPAPGARISRCTVRMASHDLLDPVLAVRRGLIAVGQDVRGRFASRASSRPS